MRLIVCTAYLLLDKDAQHKLIRKKIVKYGALQLGDILLLGIFILQGWNQDSEEYNRVNLTILSF